MATQQDFFLLSTERGSRTRMTTRTPAGAHMATGSKAVMPLTRGEEVGMVNTLLGPYRNVGELPRKGKMKSAKNVQKEHRTLLPTEVHIAICDVCNRGPPLDGNDADAFKKGTLFSGTRYNCDQCPEQYDLCEDCYNLFNKQKKDEESAPALHDRKHTFTRVEEDPAYSVQVWWDMMKDDEREQYKFGGNSSYTIEKFRIRTEMGWKSGDGRWERPLISANAAQERKNFIKKLQETRVWAKTPDWKKAWSALDPTSQAFWLKYYAVPSSEELYDPLDQLFELTKAVEAELDAEKEEWEEFVYRNDDVGLFTLMVIWPFRSVRFSDFISDYKESKETCVWAWYDLRTHIKDLLIHLSVRVGHRTDHGADHHLHPKIRRLRLGLVSLHSRARQKASDAWHYPHLLSTPLGSHLCQDVPERHATTRAEGRGKAEGLGQQRTLLGAW
eukprot:506871-Rhodomonas_salina.2